MKYFKGAQALKVWEPLLCSVEQATTIFFPRHHSQSCYAAFAGIQAKHHLFVILRLKILSGEI
jgi:hypothetical protein